MKKPWLSALLNFFTIGLGTVYNGRRVFFGVVLTLGAFSLTYIEQKLNVPATKDLYTQMFATILIMNAFFAWDGYKEAKEINSSKQQV